MTSAQHSRRLYRRLAADVNALDLPSGPATPEPVSQAQLSGLPATAQRYLRFMGVIGRPPDWSFMAHLTGRFRLRPGLPWLPCEAWQYNSGPGVARLFHMRIDVAGVLPMTGRDAYVHGRGRMLGKLAGLVTVANASGAENDLSELVTYLNDAVFMAPGMLLAGHVRWAAVDERSFDVTIGDHGHQVTARVVTDPSGAPVDFSTEDRWCDLPGGPVRARWSTPVEGRVMPHGRWQPTRGSAIWHLPEGPFRYADFRFAPGIISYNVPPAALLIPQQLDNRSGLAPAVRRLRNWGATEHEQRAELPGDELVPGEASVTTSDADHDPQDAPRHQAAGRAPRRGRVTAGCTGVTQSPRPGLRGPH